MSVINETVMSLGQVYNLSSQNNLIRGEFERYVNSLVDKSENVMNLYYMKSIVVIYTKEYSDLSEKAAYVLDRIVELEYYGRMGSKVYTLGLIMDLFDSEPWYKYADYYQELIDKKILLEEKDLRERSIITLNKDLIIESVEIVDTKPEYYKDKNEDNVYKHLVSGDI